MSMMKSKFMRNLSWIFVGNIVHAVLQYIVNIIAARLLTTADYGIIDFSAALITFFTAVGTFGISHTVTKFFADKEENADQYLGTAVFSRSIFAIAAICFIQVLLRLTDPHNTTLHIVALVQSFSIFFSAFDVFIYWYRYKNQANIVAIVRLIAFFFSAAFRLAVLFFYRNIVAYVVGIALETLTMTAILLILYLRSAGKLKIRGQAFKEMMRLSYPFVFSAVLTTVYGQTDKIMLKTMLSVESVAYYSVALTLAGTISIIPIALIDGFRPEIMKFSNIDKPLYGKRFSQLYACVFWICIAYCVFVTIFAEHIVLLLYGQKYMPAVEGLSVVVWYTSFSYFGAINNIYMICEKKTGWVQFTTLVGAVMNVLLNLLLIPYWGIKGAAVASLITQIAINFVLPALVPALRPCFKFMIQGIFLKNVLKK